MTPWFRRAARGGLTVLATSVVVLAGAWAAGGVVTDDATTAKVLTAGWFGTTGAAAVLLARTRAVPAAAVVLGWFVTAALAGGFLLVTSTVDRVVDERVVVAADPAPAGSGRTVPVATLEATGRFRDGAHETRGSASLVRTAEGDRVLTLTGFTTAPGPDLRVYLVPPRSGVEDAVDLGRLKGNRGDQQYVVPRALPTGSVVIWCRAFSVAFGTAVLRAPA